MSIISLPIEQEELLVSSIKKSGKNNEKSWSIIYKHYQPHILRFFRVRIQTEEAEDLTSIVFKKAMGGINNFRWQGKSLSAWLYAIARNVLIDYIRKQKCQKEVRLEEVEYTSAEPNHQDGQILFLNQWIWQKINQLPPKEHKIMYLKFFDGYTNKTISKVTGLSETNVATIIHRTVKKLRQQAN